MPLLNLEGCSHDAEVADSPAVPMKPASKTRMAKPTRCILQRASTHARTGLFLAVTGRGREQAGTGSEADRQPLC